MRYDENLLKVFLYINMLFFAKYMYEYKVTSCLVSILKETCIFSLRIRCYFNDVYLFN